MVNVGRIVAELKSYPKMKDSGVPWLGQVPEHWDVTSVRRYCRVFAGATPSRGVAEYWRGGTIPWLASGDVNLRRITGARQFITEEGYEASSTKWIKPGSLVVALAGQGRTKGMVATVECRTTCNQSLAALEPSPTTSDYRFLAYYLESRYLDLRALVGDSLRDGLNLEHIRAIPTPLPPLVEQTAVVRFLDHADRRIGRYIRAKQKLIKLLEEQKQAIIHRAITRGLDPNVRLKPSGVEWLGDVPEHWEVKRLHQITDPQRPVMYGIVLPGSNVDDGVYIVKGGNCEPGRLRSELLSRTTFQIESRYARSRLMAGDIVFAIRGGVGGSELVPPELVGANLTQDAARIAAGSAAHPQWLLHAVRAPIFREHVKSQVVGATVRGINICDLQRIEIVVPPLDEQAEIVEYLECATRDLVSTIDRTHREIALLREYRTRLIADVVTGKLDVREAAAHLPDESAPAPLDEPDALTDADEVPAEDADALSEEAAE